MHHDIAIIGAGPAGLCFARALVGSGLRVALVEQAGAATLADPPDDGREIALTHHSRRLMHALGLWQRLREDDVGLLRDAQVLDGDDRDGLLFSHREAGCDNLGWLVGNRAIRRAAWEAVQGQADLQVVDGARVTGVHVDDEGARLALADGRCVHAHLLVAADSRFSESRRAVGIRADMRDFGRTMLVCRMRHQAPHRQTAWEWFRYGQTLALLPLRDPQVSSAVLTLPQQEAQRLQALPEDAFNREIAARFDGRLGAMERVAAPMAYPLVGVYPQRFVATRFAAIGDAAVGMHPVTAHGFNFGLLGVEALARRVLAAQRAGEPFWSASLLQDYDVEHRANTRPLYEATRLLAALYGNDAVPARALRKIALRLGQRLPMFRRMVMASLTDQRDHSRLDDLRRAWLRLRPR